MMVANSFANSAWMCGAAVHPFLWTLQMSRDTCGTIFRNVTNPRIRIPGYVFLDNDAMSVSKGYPGYTR